MIALMILGAAFEVAGIAVIVWEVWSDLRTASDPKLAPGITRTVGAATVRLSMGTPTIVVEGAQPPTLEERASALEREVERLREDVKEVRDEKIPAVEQSVSKARTDLTNLIYENQEYVRSVFRTILAGDTSVRLLGVLLLVIGLGIATAANVLSVTS